jgi:ATP-binding cassette subfamily B protein
MIRTFPYYKQLDQMDCGPTCLPIIAKYYGRSFKLQTLRQLCEINREGVFLYNAILNRHIKNGFSWTHDDGREFTVF